MREPQDDSPRFEWDPTFAWFLLLFFLFNVGLGVFPPLLPQIMGDLQLSFAGWWLLCLISCGMGFIFLNPYMQATFAEMYCALRDAAFEQNITSPQELPGVAAF